MFIFKSGEEFRVKHKQKDEEEVKSVEAQFI